LDATELKSGFIFLDPVEDESPLGIVQKAESVSRLLHFNSVHEPGRIVEVRSDLSVNLHATLHTDLLAFLSGKGVLKTLAKDDGDGKALPLLVGTSRRLGGPDAPHFPEIPVTGRIKALEVLSRSASHLEELLFLIWKEMYPT